MNQRDSSRRATRRKSNPHMRFALVGLLLTAAGAGLLLWYTTLPPLVVYFIALSVCAFVLCAYDKKVAGGAFTRVPENVLFGVALLGGTPGLLLGMNVFRHKTRKLSFQLIFAVIMIVQALVAYWFIANRG